MPETRDVTVTDAWYQASDGTAEVLVQVIAGLLYMRLSDSEPVAGARGHIIRNTVYFAVGEVSWIRSVSPGSEASVVIT